MRALARNAACLLFFGVALTSATSLAATLEWQFERYADPMHKSGIVAVASQASDPDGSDIVIATVRCWSATADLDVRFILKSGRSFGNESVRWQFDKGPIRTARWRLSPRGDAVVVPEASANEIVRGMRNGKDFVLLVASDAEHRYHIPLAGSSRAIGEMQEICKR
jgi:hypothetical protein